MDNNSLGDERMIIMQLTRTNVFTRWPCHICGAETEKVAMLCEGDADGTLLRCCEVCIRGGQGQLDGRIRNNIASLEQHVEFLRSIVGRVSIPTYAEWQVAEERAFDDECGTENGEAELSLENVGALFDEEALQRHAERRERGEKIADILAEALKPLAAERCQQTRKSMSACDPIST